MRCWRHWSSTGPLYINAPEQSCSLNLICKREDWGCGGGRLGSCCVCAPQYIFQVPIVRVCGSVHVPVHTFVQIERTGLCESEKVLYPLPKHYLTLHHVRCLDWPLCCACLFLDFHSFDDLAVHALTVLHHIYVPWLYCGRLHVHVSAKLSCN